MEQTSSTSTEIISTANHSKPSLSGDNPSTGAQPPVTESTTDVPGDYVELGKIDKENQAAGLKRGRDKLEEDGPTENTSDGNDEVTDEEKLEAERILSAKRQALERMNRAATKTESVGKRPPKDMKRLDKDTWYEVLRVARWGETPALLLQPAKSKEDKEAQGSTESGAIPGFFKPPESYLTYDYQIGDKIKVTDVGYSRSRNKIATAIDVDPAPNVPRRTSTHRLSENDHFNDYSGFRHTPPQSRNSMFMGSSFTSYSPQPAQSRPGTYNAQPFYTVDVPGQVFIPKNTGDNGSHPLSSLLQMPQSIYLPNYNVPCPLSLGNVNSIVFPPSLGLPFGGTNGTTLPMSLAAPFPNFLHQSRTPNNGIPNHYLNLPDVNGHGHNINLSESNPK